MTQFSTGWGRPSPGGFFGPGYSFNPSPKVPEPINSRADEYKSPGDNRSPAGDTIPAGIGTSSYDGKIVWFGGFGDDEDNPFASAIRQIFGTASPNAASFVALFSDCIFTDSFSLLKLYADDQVLISNVAPQKQTSQKVRFYDGTQTTPDPFLVQVLGADKASAWPGFCYAVFENFDCAPYGNRVPLIRAVVSGAVTNVAATEEQSTLTFGAIDPAYTNNYLAADRFRNHAYLFYWQGDDDGYISVIDVASNSEISRAFVQATNYSLLEYMLALDGTDYLVATGFETSGTAHYDLLLINAHTGELVSRLEALLDSGSPLEARPHTAVMIQSGSSTKFLVFCGTFSSGVAPQSNLGILLVDVTAGSMSWIVHPYTHPAPGANEPYSIAVGPVENGVCTFWYAESNGNVLSIYKGTASTSGFGGAVFHTETVSSAITLDHIGVAYDPEEDEVLIYWSTTFPSTITGMRKLDANGSVVWSVTSPLASLAINWSRSSYSSFFYVARPGYVIATESGGSGSVYQIDLSDGSTTLLIDKSLYSWEGSFGYFNQITGEYVEDSTNAGIVNKITLGDATPNDVDLVDMFTQIITVDDRFDAVDLSFSGFPGNETKGLKVENDTTFENLEQSVAEPFDVKIVESDGLRKYIYPPRDGSFAIDVTIPPAHFLEDGSKTIEKLIGAGEDEYQGCTVEYFDVDADYKKLEQTYQRPIGIFDVTRSRKRRTINTLLSLTSSQAMRAATTIVYRSVFGNEGYGFGLTPPLAYVEPASIVQYGFRGSTVIARITDATLKADFTQECRAHQYLQFADGTFTGSSVEQGAGGSTSADVRLIMLDIPLLSSVHDLAGAGLVHYALITGYGPNPIAQASLYRSSDGTNYSKIGTRSGIAPVTGIITAISGTPADPFTKDETNTIQVRVTSGDIDDLATITDSQFENGVNLAAIGRNGRWVLVWFQTVSSSDGTAALSDLMWGVNGSEVWIDSLQTGDLFVHLKSDQYIRFREAVADLDDTFYYKVAYSTVPLGAAPTTAHAASGVAEKPYASRNLIAEFADGGDIRFSWDYRSRVASGLNPENDGEASLEFELDIIDTGSSPETVVRTLTVSTNEATWTAAQITSDFGSLPTTWDWEVYMMSELVGRGYAARQTSTVVEGSILTEGDAQSGTDQILLEGDEQSGTDAETFKEIVNG